MPQVKRDKLWPRCSRSKASGTRITAIAETALIDGALHQNRRALIIGDDAEWQVLTADSCLSMCE